MNFQLYRVDSPDMLVDMGVTVTLQHVFKDNIESFDNDDVLIAIGPHIHVSDPSLLFEYKDNMVTRIYVFDCDIQAYELVRM